MHPPNRVLLQLFALMMLAANVAGGARAAAPFSADLPRRADWQMRILPPSGTTSWGEVISVESGSPAERAGLRKGDRITHIDGARTDEPSEFDDARRASRGGAPVRLMFTRGELSQEARFTPRSMALEADPALAIQYEVLTSSSGIRQRAIVTRPKEAKSKLPSLLLIPWLSCASVEVLNRPPTGMNRLLAGIVRESGFLTLRVERPGVGDSAGPACSRTDLTTELAGLRAGLQRLKAHPHFDPDRLFLLGMSLGGGMVAHVAEGEKLRGIVSVVGLVKTWFEHMMEIERRRLTLSGRSPEQVNDAMRALAVLYTEYLIHGRTPGEVIQERPALEKYWEDEPGHQYGRPAAYYEQVQALNLEAAWQKVKVPTLIVAGEYDWIMSQDDYDQMAAMVNRNTPGAATLVRWPRASHELEQFPSREAAFKEEGGVFDDALIKLVVSWLRETSGR